MNRCLIMVAPLMACFALFSRFAMAAEPAGQASGPDKTPTSILANSDFSKGSGVKPESWDIAPESLSAKKVTRQPKSADSQDWILAAEPGTYVICQQAVMMTPGQKYTLKIVARSLGEDSTLGVCQYDPPDTVVQIFWQTPLTKEFQPYVKTFTASPKMKRIILYSVAPGKQGGPGQDALEIAGAYLYEGEVDQHGSTVPNHPEGGRQGTRFNDWGAHAPSRVAPGASPGDSGSEKSAWALISARGGACAPQP